MKGHYTDIRTSELHGWLMMIYHMLHGNLANLPFRPIVVVLSLAAAVAPPKG